MNDDLLTGLDIEGKRKIKNRERRVRKGCQGKVSKLIMTILSSYEKIRSGSKMLVNFINIEHFKVNFSS